MSIKEIFIRNDVMDADDEFEMVKLNGDFFKITVQSAEEINSYYYKEFNTSDIDIENTIKVFEDFCNEKIFNFIMNFDNWKQEREVHRTLLSLVKGAEKKQLINTTFESKQSLYTDSEEEISLIVDQKGINYLEYDLDANNLQGYIYNISMGNLLNLYNLNGKKLFKYNVRNGIKNTRKIQSLKQDFKTYINIGLNSKTENKDLKEYIDDYIMVEEEEYEYYKPSIFWFNHNGVNIFVESNESFSVEGNMVHIVPNHSSVINGAQTLTCFFDSLEEIKTDYINEIRKVCEKINENPEVLLKDFESILSDVLEETIVKVVFIVGDSKYSRQITWGLNNQIPISKEDMSNISKEVEQINELLKQNQMKIAKIGEDSGMMSHMNALEFIKNFLIITQSPGKSKNFDKTKLDDELKAALNKMKKSTNHMLRQLSIILEIDNWWTKEIKTKQTKTIFDRFGLNYFKSFVLSILEKKEATTSFTINDLDMYYKMLEEQKLIRNSEDKDYKSDELYKKINISEIIQDNLKANEIDIKSLIEYVNENRTSNRNYHRLITNYMFEKNKTTRIFRTVSIIDNRIKEHFAFPSSTFEEFYLNLDEKNYLEFEESTFYKELQKNYEIFFIIMNDTNDRVIDINYVDNFNFLGSSDSVAAAKQTYDRAKEAFFEGEKELLPKSSFNGKFHVRPKAKNKDDVFKFTDGSELVKQTFWANSDFVFEIMISLKEEIIKAEDSRNEDITLTEKIRQYIPVLFDNKDLNEITRLDLWNELIEQYPELKDSPGVFNGLLQKINKKVGPKIVNIDDKVFVRDEETKKYVFL